MPSPVLQARRQLDLLLALLGDHTAELMDRSLLGLRQRTFAGAQADVLVAVSDSGRITRRADVPELAKADQVPDRVKGAVQAEQNRAFGAFRFTDAELGRLQTFLRGRHVPARPAVPDAPHPDRRSAAPVRTSQERQSQARPRPDVACRACGGASLSVQFGKYGYYFKCAGCGGNTPAKPVCAQCGQPGKVSKRGLEFTATCTGGHSWPYWTNPA